MTTRSRGIFLLILGAAALAIGVFVGLGMDQPPWRIAGVVLIVLGTIPVIQGARLLRRTGGDRGSDDQP